MCVCVGGGGGGVSKIEGSKLVYFIKNSTQLSKKLGRCSKIKGSYIGVWGSKIKGGKLEGAKIKGFQI